MYNKKAYQQIIIIFVCSHHYVCGFYRRVASGACAFRVCSPDLFLAPLGIFLGEKNCCFWPEKPFEFMISARKSLRISAKTFFFWKSPDFHWNFVLIQFRNNESLGQVQRWFSTLCPPDFNFAHPISRSWRRPYVSIQFLKSQLLADLKLVMSLQDQWSGFVLWVGVQANSFQCFLYIKICFESFVDGLEWLQSGCVWYSFNDFLDWDDVW